jgi:hypothetical protein
VGGEHEILAVHVRDQVRHADLSLCVGVGKIAPEADRVGVSAAVVLVAVVSAVEAAARCDSGRDRCGDQRGEDRQHPTAHP